MKFLPKCIVKVWNKLPYDVGSSTTVAFYKKMHFIKILKSISKSLSKNLFKMLGLTMMAISGESPLLFSQRLKMMVI